jgi:hypothetical protein
LDDVRDRLVADAAGRESARICRRVIRTLQGMRDALHSGDDSGLRDAWDEFCVQVQSEESVFREAYEDTVRQVIAEEIRRLPPTVRETIWLQTDAGIDWTVEMSDTDEGRPVDRRALPVADEDVVDYLYREYVLAQAGDWSNPRIRAYLDRQ